MSSRVHDAGPPPSRPRRAHWQCSRAGVHLLSWGVAAPPCQGGMWGVHHPHSQEQGLRCLRDIWFVCVVI